jgi:hypothetical protein
MSLQNQIDILALGLFNANNKKRVDGFGIYEPILAPCVTQECVTTPTSKDATYKLPKEDGYSTLEVFANGSGEKTTANAAYYFDEAFFSDEGIGKTLSAIEIINYYNGTSEKEDDINAIFNKLTGEHITTDITKAAKISNILSYIIDKYGKIIDAKTETYEKLENARLILNDGILDGPKDGFDTIPEKTS